MQRRPIQLRPAVSIVDVFFDEHVTRASDLLFQFDDLAFDRSLLSLHVGAYSCIQHRLFHTNQLIPERRQEVESNPKRKTNHVKSQIGHDTIPTGVARNDFH